MWIHSDLYTQVSRYQQASSEKQEVAAPLFGLRSVVARERKSHEKISVCLHSSTGKKDVSFLNFLLVTELRFVNVFYQTHIQLVNL
jgi:hypothetical protein